MELSTNLMKEATEKNASTVLVFRTLVYSLQGLRKKMSYNAQLLL